MFKLQTSNFKLQTILILIGLLSSFCAASSVLRVESLDEQYYSNSNQTSVRIRIENRGLETLKNVRISYYARVSSFNNFALEPHYLAGAKISVDTTDAEWARVDISLDSLPMGLFPNASGICFGIHNKDWFQWNKLDDFSQPTSNIFSESTSLPVFIGGNLFHGLTPKLVASAVKDLRIQALQIEDFSGLPAWVEMRNTGDSSMSLGSFYLKTGAITPVALPSMELPAGSRLRVEIGELSSCEEVDFSDSLGCISLRELQFDMQGELTLISGSTPVSYVAWGGLGVLPIQRCI